jgi:hypothetical protein
LIAQFQAPEAIRDEAAAALRQNRLQPTLRELR